MKHELKCRKEFFQAAWVGDKPFEIRFNDRNFQERDEIVLQEIDPEEEGHLNDTDYTGREIEGVIEYLTSFEQKPNWVVFSYRETGRKEE